MSVIEFAEHRLAEEERQHELGADNRYDLHYWAAYLDGARAQRNETTTFPSGRERLCKNNKNGVCAFYSDRFPEACEYDRRDLHEADCLHFIPKEAEHE